MMMERARAWSSGTWLPLLVVPAEPSTFVSTAKLVVCVVEQTIVVPSDDTLRVASAQSKSKATRHRMTEMVHRVAFTLGGGGTHRKPPSIRKEREHFSQISTPHHTADGKANPTHLPPPTAQRAAAARQTLGGERRGPLTRRARPRRSGKHRR